MRRLLFFTNSKMTKKIIKPADEIPAKDDVTDKLISEKEEKSDEIAKGLTDEFIETCKALSMWPCMDGKHKVAIKLKDAPSINTWAWLQYGMHVSIWYDGKIQETKYFKYRDWYSSSWDDRGNCFRSVLDIFVDDESWEVKVIAQANGYSARTIRFHIEKKVAMPEVEKEEFESKFKVVKEKILKDHTRDATAPLIYHMAYRWELTALQDPYKETPYEEAKLISHAIDYTKWLAAIVISAQIDASMRSGRQMEYVWYVVYSDGRTKQVRRDTIYADAIKAGESVAIPDAHKLIKEEGE